MNAAILAVGSEMLTADKVDTNSLFLTGQLNTLGVEVVEKAIVGDDRSRLATVVAQLLTRADILIITGGLGPTEDDVTRDAVASAAGLKLTFSQSECDIIAERFVRLNRPMAEINRRQAYVLETAEILPNVCGTAPGQWLDCQGRIVLLLPGPPKEMRAMWELQCAPRLRQRLPKLFIRTLTLRIAGMGESEVDEIVAPVYTRYVNPACTILAGAGDITLHLRARCDTAQEAERLVMEVGDQIESMLGDRIYSRDSSNLEATVIRLLQDRAETVAVAESCTGGLLAQRLTSIPGSSQVVNGGFVTYTNAAKEQLLGINRELLECHTAVSEAVATAMAQRAREILGCTYGLSTTGFAGPAGGTEANPVGTVYLGIASAAGALARRVYFFGDRDRIRTLAAQSALDLLRRKLIKQA